MDNITLSEQLMQRGWWEDALKVIERADIQPADRTLQGAALTCRRECVAYLLALDLEDMTLAQIQAELQNRFDRYTVQWVLNDYIRGGFSGMAKKRRGERPDVLIQVALEIGTYPDGLRRRKYFYGHTRAEANAKKETYRQHRESELTLTARRTVRARRFPSAPTISGIHSAPCCTPAA